MIGSNDENDDPATASAAAAKKWMRGILLGEMKKDDPRAQLNQHLQLSSADMYCPIQGTMGFRSALTALFLMG